MEKYGEFYLLLVIEINQCFTFLPKRPLRFKNPHQQQRALRVKLEPEEVRTFTPSALSPALAPFLSELFLPSQY